MIEEVIQKRQAPVPEAAPHWLRAQEEKQVAMQRAHQFLLQRIETLEDDLSSLRGQLAEREAAPSLIPSNPLVGIEVIPKKEVVIPDIAPEPINHADRLLMNNSARMALEEEEAAEEEAEEEVVEEAVEETHDDVVEEAHEEVEEEAHEEVEEEAEGEAEEELEEFEYKGATYYRDSENSVYMTDADGELTVIGVWSDVKKRIIVKKPDA
jgi:hypothetical protein